MFLQEEMNTWIQAIQNATTGSSASEKSEITPSNQSTPASSRAQTLPATVTLTTESSPGKVVLLLLCLIVTERVNEVP